MQVFFFMLAIFIIALSIVITKHVVTSFFNEWDNVVESTEQMQEAQEATLSGLETFDYGMVLLTIFLMIGMIITSFMIPTHPVFLVINIFGIFFLVFLGMVMTNVYGEFVAGDNPVLGTAAETFSYTTYLINHLPYLGAILILITTIVMFTRS